MPHASNPQTFEKLVGKQPKVECLIARVSEVTGWGYLKSRYHYFDKRSKSLSLTHLREISSQKIQKVRSNITSNHIKRGVAYEDITSSPDNSKGNG